MAKRVFGDDAKLIPPEKTASLNISFGVGLVVPERL